MADRGGELYLHAVIAGEQYARCVVRARASETPVRGARVFRRPSKTHRHPIHTRSPHIHFTRAIQKHALPARESWKRAHVRHTLHIIRRR
ncbi:hypothetical protein HPB48_003038 [Haemaphysalis longicornis]|uniref:Uncharacterized protein n=1 Tax=Haemaphysalis longicornis TaxID=44386 RepID=A0A9J6FMT3_HAELO|nr:hypothetical protein HPB48_003038 [Haemaphysalis longicornis]